MEGCRAAEVDDCSRSVSFRRPEIHVSSNPQGFYLKEGGTNHPRQTITFVKTSLPMNLHAVNKSSPASVW